MLAAEEANKRLETLRDKEWLAKAEARADALPDGLRQATRTFLTPIPAFWRGDSYEEFRARQDAAVRQVDKAPGDQRAEVMAAIHPRLGPVLDRWWIDARKRPYQRGWGRKAFRAPGFPGMSAWSRGIDLTVLASIAGPFDADPAWLAVWAAHLPHTQTHNWTSEPAAIGGLLASAIDLGGSAGDETLATLIEVGNGEHPVGIMGRHVITALLGSSRPEGWEFVERLLLNAQLQEGLRQTILEAADQGHPEAFDRMLRLVLDHKLLRFPAAVRAAGIWRSACRPGERERRGPAVPDRPAERPEQARSAPRRAWADRGRAPAGGNARRRGPADQRFAEPAAGPADPAGLTAARGRAGVRCPAGRQQGQAAATWRQFLRTRDPAMLACDFFHADCAVTRRRQPAA